MLTKFHPAGCDTIRSVLDHEIGHQLDNLLGIGNLQDIQDLYTSRTLRELTDDLSEYAWNNKNKNKFSEMIAEGWAEYCNNPNPREIAKKIGDNPLTSEVLERGIRIQKTIWTALDLGGAFMTEKEFIDQAKKMGYSDKFIEETIDRHNRDKFVLPYEKELIGVIDNYPSESDS